MNQTEMVYKYMQENGSITTWEAIQQLGVTRLSSKIFNLRKKFNIADEKVIFINRYGKRGTFKKYWIEEKEGN